MKKEKFLSLLRDTKECIEWPLSKIGDTGYGKVKYQGRTWRAHRLSYVLTNGDIPEKFFVCHTCDNKLCINPTHLYVGSPSDNISDSMRRGGRNDSKKLSRDVVVDIIKSHFIKKETGASIARKYNVSSNTIYHILRGSSYQRIYKEVMNE